MGTSGTFARKRPPLQVPLLLWKRGNSYCPLRQRTGQGGSPTLRGAGRTVHLHRPGRHFTGLPPGRGAVRITGEATMDNRDFIIEIRSKTDFLAEIRADLGLIEAGKKEEEPVERVFFESIDAANRLLTPKRVELL